MRTLTFVLLASCFATPLAMAQSMLGHELELEAEPIREGNNIRGQTPKADVMPGTVSEPT